MPFADFSQNISEIRKHIGLADSVEDCYRVVYDFIEKHDYQGACHEMSAVMFVLLQELGVGCELTSGELTYRNYRFDHSWIEIEGKVFDIAVSFTGVPDHDGPPVFADVTVTSLSKPKWVYGEPSDDPDQGYVISHSLPFGDYMTANPTFKNGSFGLVEQLAKDLNLDLNVGDLISRYSSTVWNNRVSTKG